MAAATRQRADRSFTYTGSSFTWNGYTITNGTTYNSGSPVVRTYTYGNVAFIQLDGNDLSAEISENNGYTGGQQTNWLLAQLATYRAGTAVDFVVVYFHNCMYCTNGTHGSDGGVRNVWQPIFDNWNVDLVVNGHVHAYERSQPLFNNVPVKQVASGGSYTNFYTEQGALTPPSGAISATTYFCAGGGGQSLYTSWLGFSGGDDSTSGDGTVAGDTNAAANTFATGTSPFLDVWKVSGTVESGTATGAPAGATGAATGGSTETIRPTARRRPSRRGASPPGPTHHQRHGPHHPGRSDLHADSRRRRQRFPDGGDGQRDHHP